MKELISLTNSTAIIVLTELTEVDPESCKLLGPFAIMVQAIMGLLVIGSLLLKRARESPKRKWRVWIADLSKQILGQAFVHGTNVLISDQIASHKSDNPCSLYFINIAIDTTFGVLLLYTFLLLLTSLLLIHSPTEFKTGYYGNPFSLKIWSKQATVYVISLALMKGVVVALFWIIPGLVGFGNWALTWLSNDDAQVVFVMLIFPLVMNILQFLIIDSFLKSKSTSPTLMEEGAFSSHEDDEERGFLDPSDEDFDQLPSPSLLNHSRSNSRSNSNSGIISQSKYGASNDNDRIQESKGKDGRSSRSRNNNEEQDQFIIDSDNSDSDDDEANLRRPSTPSPPLPQHSNLPNINSRNNSTTSNSYPPPTSNSNTPTKKTKKKSLSLTSSTSSTISSSSYSGNGSTPTSSLIADSLAVKSGEEVGGGGSDFSTWENSPNAVLSGEKIGLRGL